MVEWRGEGRGWRGGVKEGRRYGGGMELEMVDFIYVRRPQGFGQNVT